MIAITKEIIDQIRQKGKHTFAAQIESNIDAKVFLTLKEEEEVFARAYLMTRSPSARIEEINEVSCTVRSMDMLDIDVRDLCNKLLKKLHDYRKPPASPKEKKIKPFAERVLGIPNIMDPNNFKRYVSKRGWRPSTTADSVSLFANKFGTDMYGVYGEEATNDDYMDFLEKEIDRIYSKEYNHPTKDGNIIKKRRRDIYNGIAVRWARARAVQLFLRDNYPDEEWPKTLIPLLSRYKTSSTEEIKAITYEHYIKLCVLVQRLCEAENPLAFCALGEVCNGERVGESAAHLVGDFELKDTFGRCYIDFQLDDNAMRTNVLKNEYSHRFVFFGGFVREMVLLRKSQLEAKGYCEAEYALMPFGAYNETPCDFIDKKKVSSFIRMLLKLVGCDEKWLEEEAEKMFVAAKASGNSEDLDTPAHLLRRTRATFLANGGVPSHYVDAGLGHQNDDNREIDYASWDKAEEIAAMMERAVNLGSLCNTNNPAYTAVSLRDNTDFELMGNIAYQFYAEEDTYIEIDVTALECGIGLSVIVPEAYRSTSFHLRNPSDTIESRRERPILPKLPSCEEIERWIVEAEAIDLSMFTKEER